VPKSGDRQRPGNKSYVVFGITPPRIYGGGVLLGRKCNEVAIICFSFHLCLRAWLRCIAGRSRHFPTLETLAISVRGA
jgi:hypothetical protein